ncbi:THAP domain-containing protein 5-like [Schistocerca nitens]|uniref:THAP domain-containing protein 5-like n=1 Tax=Schistocerca nitens TaxID=7011 RepID=UPI0021185082|nr:THAP domain-containing protein 5-like [Schistocerca nitens]
MPYRCCVPNCRGNYDGGPKVTVFKFPEDEATRKKWLSSIRRDNFTPSSSSRVCHVHFHKDDVIWETQIVDERTGQLLRAPLLKPRLRPDAVPSLLPNCPSYLSKEESRREGPEEKKQRLENEQLAAALQYSLASQKDYENTFSFSSLEELMLRTKKVDLSNEWSVIEKHSDFVCFLKIIRNPAPLITHSVVIDSNLNVSLFKKDVQIKTLGKRSFPVIVTNIHEIVSVLQEFSDTDCGHSETSIDNIVEIVKDSLGVLKDSLQESEKEMVDFIYEQVSLINVKKFNHRSVYGDAFDVRICSQSRPRCLASPFNRVAIRPTCRSVRCQRLCARMESRLARLRTPFPSAVASEMPICWHALWAGAAFALVQRISKDVHLQARAARTHFTHSPDTHARAIAALRGWQRFKPTHRLSAKDEPFEKQWVLEK